MNKRYYIILLTFIISAFGLAAQDSFSGREFWMAFMPNYHNAKYDDLGNQWTDYEKYGDSLYLFITSQEATNGVIEYVDINGESHFKNFEITDPNKIYTFSVMYLDYELIGNNDSGRLPVNNQGETTAYQSFHIISEKDIAVFAHSQAITTSDAMKVLPVKSLGKEYLVLTYKSDDGVSVSSNTPSQFVIIGTQDNTRVKIEPSVPTDINGSVRQDIILNEGEVYLVQADMDGFVKNLDLSGTDIYSDKPISVIAGHQRATVPVRTTGQDSPSRDFLMAQIPPVETWGNNAIIFPFKEIVNQSDIGYDMYRVVAASNNTEISYNDEYLVTLNKGEVFEEPIYEPAVIKATGPILVAEFKKTSLDESHLNSLGDPFFMILSPVEQYSNYFKCINIQAMEYSGMDFMQHNPKYERVYDEHYISIIAADSVFKSLMIDGQTVDISGLVPIDTSGFSYLLYTSSEGTHSVEADGRFYAGVYGYGVHNSYGYSGGILKPEIDNRPPQINPEEFCYGISGMITDSAEFDAGIESVEILSNETDNVDVTIGDFTGYPDTVSFTALLRDIYQDGRVGFAVYDSIGHKSVYLKDIPGFTVAPDRNIYPDRKVKVDSRIHFSRTFCYDLIIENYGKFPQVIDSMAFVGDGGFRANITYPFVIQPGMKDTIEICLQNGILGYNSTELLFINKCTELDVLSLAIKLIDDQNSPEISQTVDSCNHTATLVLTDSLPSDWGMKEIKIYELVNCTIENSSFNRDIAIYQLKISDPNQDTRYRFVAVDSMGFQKEFIGEIPGYTFELAGFMDDGYSINKVLDFDSVTIGNTVCFNLEIYNYGFLPKVIESMYVSERIWFSLAESVFPIIIQPDETKILPVCYRPLSIKDSLNTDTLKLASNCMIKELPLQGFPKELVVRGNDRCGFPVKLTAGTVPKEFVFGEGYPNPAVENYTVLIGIPHDANVEITVIDAVGINRALISNKNYKAGIYRLDLYVGDLTQGMYFIKMKTDRSIFTKKLIIDR